MVIVGKHFFSIKSLLENNHLFLMVFVCFVPDGGLLGCFFRAGAGRYFWAFFGRPTP